MKCKIIFLFTALFFWLTGNTQNVTNKGLEFWVGYGHHQYMEPSCDGSGGASNDMNMVLYLSAEEATQVTVTIDSSGPFPATWYKKVYNIPANTVISTENLPKGTVNATQSNSNPNYDARLYTDPPPSGTGGEGIFRKKGIHIVSTKPIVAYAHIYGGVSSGATMLMPVNAWGYSYTSMNSEQRDADRSYSWMYVIAKDDHTVIRVTPSATSRLGKPANQSFDVELQKGQIYQLIGQADCATGDGPELTGTTVRSIAGSDGECHGIAVFSGSSRTGGETLTCGTGSGRDNDMQQLFPEQTWGKRYLTAPFSMSSGATATPGQFQTSVFKVLVKDPSTVVKLNGTQLTGLIANKYYKFSSSTADSIIADKPVMVGQFMSGTSACNGGGGDPEMVYLSPMEQAIKRIGFYRNTRQDITVNYLTLIVPTPGLGSLRIDNSSSYYSFPHSTPGYTVVVKGWPAAQAQCIVTCDSAFTAITYGLGSAESYAYNAGTYLNNLNGISDLHNVSDTTNQGNNSHLFTCKGSPVKLSILTRYEPTRLVWKLSTLGANLTPNADVTLDPTSTAFQGNVTVNGLLYYKYTLPGTYTFNADGKFDVPVFSTSPSLTENCNNTEELTISFEVKPSPAADFTFSNPSGCARDTTFFFGPDATGISDAQQWLWTFPDGTVSHHQDTSKMFSGAGTNTVVLKVVSKEGCVASVSKDVIVGAVPVADFVVNATSYCEGNGVVLTPTAAYTGPAPVNYYYWDFGNDSTLVATTDQPQRMLYDSAAAYQVRLVAGTSKACVSDTVQKTVTIYSKPKVNITYPAGCLPANGIVQFTNNTNTPDGQTLTTHAWNFGDAAATPPGNANTSTAVSPSHQYSAFGDYNISYSVTSSQGCVTDTVIKATFNLSPDITYPAVSAVCEKDAPLSVATASVTNGVPGTYKYSGPGTDDKGMFTPALAGAGTHTITYTFTSSANCVVSKTQQITVKASPAAAFKLPAGGCLPVGGLVTLDNTSAISSGETLTWLWDFDDAYASTGNENTSTAFEPSHTFRDGSYTIRLTATAASGCADDTTIVAPLSVTPAVDYPAITPVCESAAAYSIATATVNGAVVAGGTYSGTGVSSAGMFNPATAGAGTHSITYTYTTAAGCTATKSSSVQVYARPAASFTADGNACLGEQTHIIPANTAGVQTWNWKLGDGTTRTAGNSTAFDVTYAAANDYVIELTTVNQLGCTSDPETKTVSVHPLPVANFDVPVKICLPGEAVFHNTTTVADNSSLSYAWDFGDGSGTVVADKDPSHTYARAGSYPVKLTATSYYSCKNTTGAKVVNDFYQRPTAGFNVTPVEICQGAEVSFTDASTPAGAIAGWSWDFGDGSNTATTRSATKRFNNPGQYTVKLTVTNNAGCTASTPKTVTVHLQPQIDAGRSFVVLQGTSIQFEASANSPALSLSWTPAGDLTGATTLHPVLVVNKDATYRLTAVGEFNCTATDSLTVKMLKTVEVPNAFSPNGDNNHDRWLIPNLSDYPGCSVQVFNRYGQKVFESKGYGTSWDGTNGGNPLPMGTYYYVIRLGDGSAPITGAVTIIR